MYLILNGHYEKSAQMLAIAETYEQAESIATAEMQCMDPFRDWVLAYPESLSITHFHIELKVSFPYVIILTIPAP